MEKSGYGVARLSVIAVRAEAADKSEQVTQLLFGDHYQVIDETKDKKWIRIKIHSDQYEGWIDHLQHHAITAEYFEYFNRAEFKITTDLTSTMLYNKIPMVILMGSIIPISSTELFKMEEQFAFNGEAKNVGQKREFEFLKTIALRYLNAPYQWGGKSPFGIDCSGFIQTTFKICGYSLPRDAWQQSTQGRRVESFMAARPGDLLFFRNQEERIHHVGILLGENKIIHASGKVRVDPCNEEGIFQSDTRIQTHRLAHIQRILLEG